MADAAATANEPCTHETFDAKLDFNRIQPDATGMPMAFTVDLQVFCAACATPFVFPGMVAGLSYDEPRVSVDGTELRAPMRPFDKGDMPSGLPSFGVQVYVDERP